MEKRVRRPPSPLARLWTDLFQSRLYAPNGLMRANWPSDELFSPDRRSFELSAEQRESVDNYFGQFTSQKILIAPFGD
jgi:hypothetical protein